MIRFSASSYARILASKPNVRDRELRNRLTPSSQGYDFHKKMRKLAVGYACGILSPDETKMEIEKIKNPAEQNSAKEAIKRLGEWKNGRKIEIY